MGGSSEAASSLPYSLREIILERGPVSVVVLYDGETMEGRAAQGLEFGRR